MLIFSPPSLFFFSKPFFRLISQFFCSSCDLKHQEIMEPTTSWVNGFVGAFSMILVSEIGDKTFFIASLMAMRYNRLTVYLGAVGALALMTVFSAFLGTIVPHLISIRNAKLLSGVLFFIFAGKILYDEFCGSDDDDDAELEQAEEALRSSELEVGRGRSRITRCWTMCTSPVMVEAFTLVFFAEWGDRSQMATIVLASSSNPYAVTLGGILGHALCTGMAVLGGGIIGDYVSSRSISIVGGLLFIIFGVLAIADSLRMTPNHK